MTSLLALLWAYFWEHVHSLLKQHSCELASPVWVLRRYHDYTFLIDFKKLFTKQPYC